LRQRLHRHGSRRSAGRSRRFQWLPVHSPRAESRAEERGKIRVMCCFHSVTSPIVCFYPGHDLINSGRRRPEPARSDRQELIGSNPKRRHIKPHAIEGTEHARDHPPQPAWKAYSPPPASISGPAARAERRYSRRYAEATGSPSGGAPAAHA
jgi:hypothetical protein